MPTIPPSETLTVLGTINANNAAGQTHKPLSVSDAEVATDADITWSKVQGALPFTHNFDLLRTDTPVAKDHIVWEARAAGVIDFVYAGLFESGSSTDVNFNLKLDGTTVLSSVINVVHGTGDHTAVGGTLSTTTFATGAVFSMDLAITSSTGAQGPYMTVGWHYTAIPS